MTSAQFLALVIFGLTYLLISFQKLPFLKLDRPGAVLFGATAMLATGVLTLEQAYALINFDTIVLLLGMMIFIGYLQDASFFRLIAHGVLRRARSPVQLLVFVSLTAGLLSALFVNDTMCVILTPLVLRLCLDADLDPRPFLIATATSANIGSVMTLVGNPQNMLIGVYSGIPFADFFLVMAPIAALSLAANLFIIRWRYRDRLRHWAHPPHTVRPVTAKSVIRLGIVVTLASLVAFFVTSNLPLVALGAGTVMLLLVNRSSTLVFRHVDWSLLFFFSGLFIVVGGLEHTGLSQQVFHSISPHLGTTPTHQILSWSLLSLVASNLVSNVPFVMLIRELLPLMDHARLLWLTVAMASTFAGNFTVIGSVANLIVLEKSKHVAPIGFWEFFQVGALTTLVSTAIGVSALLVMR